MVTEAANAASSLAASSFAIASSSPSPATLGVRRYISTTFRSDLLPNVPRKFSNEYSYSFTTQAKEQDRSALDWVPPAYRGDLSAGSYSSHGGDRRPNHHGKNNRGNQARKHGRHGPLNHNHHKQRKIQDKLSRQKKREVAKSKAAKAELQKDLDRLNVLSGELRRIITNYRIALDPQTAKKLDDQSKVLKLSADVPAEVQTKKIQNILKNLNGDFEALKMLHDIHPQLLTDSDNLFRGLCRVLQDIVQASCKSYKHETQREVVALIELAEACLRALKDLRSQRAGFFERMQNKENGNNLTQQKEESSPSSWIAPLAHVASYITNSFSKFTVPRREETVDQTVMAHNDVDLAPSQQSFGNLVSCIAMAAADKAVMDDAGKRVVDLINVLPDGKIPESRTMLKIFEILCNSGTLEMAQECHRLFKKYSPDIPHIPFALVLRSYLEASRAETTHERKKVAVKEVLGVFESRWDANPPRHTEERIAQGAGVLHCIAVSGMSIDPAIKQAADKVVQRVLGESAYPQFHKDATAVSGRVNAEYVPIINFLACVYASSGDANNINQAKAMVNNILRRETDIDRRYTKYPNATTLNCILDGILRLHQDSTDELDINSDLVFVTSLIDFAMSRRESRVWTNQETFDLIMDLYTTLKPPHVGELMEDLVSHCETMVHTSNKVHNHVSLATYNRVIWGLWKEAVLKEPRRTSQRALALLEKLEMLSIPLLLTTRQLQAIDGIKLYHTELQPSAKTYEMVLSVCADTAYPGEYEMAASVANAVGSRLLGIEQVHFKAKVVDKVKICLDRLSPDSYLVKPTKKMLAELEKKAVEVQSSNQTPSES